MPNQYVNKVQKADGTVIMDISDTTAVAADVSAGKYFYTAAGEKVQGTASGAAAISIVDELDSHGGTIRHINGVSLQGDTVSADKMLSGVTAHDASGTAITGSISNGTARVPSTISGTSANMSAGTNQLTFSKTIALTPDVTAGYIASGTERNASVSLTANVTTKASATYHPSTSDQTISAITFLTGNQVINGVTTSNLTADNIKKGVTVQVGDSTDADCVTSVTGTYEGGGSGKNAQIQSRVARTSQTSYTDMGFEITVAKTGTYNIYWAGYRSSTSSGTNGAQIYVNGSSRGSAYTTFNSTYANCMTGHLDSQSLTAGDKVTIRARARNTSSYFYVYNLTIIEV